ncbi:MAG TPA: glyoxalase superfamily protein, partial [Ignavibacteriaceae bacterium]
MKSKITSQLFEELKAQAKRERKASGESQTAALNRLAKDLGYSNWSVLAKHVEDRSQYLCFADGTQLKFDNVSDLEHYLRQEFHQEILLAGFTTKEELELDRVEKSLAAAMEAGFSTIEDHVYSVVLDLVRENPEFILSYVDTGYVTDDMMELAFSLDGSLIDYFPDVSDHLQMIAVTQHWGSIEHIEYPSEAVQLLAVQQSFFALDLIDNPTQKVIQVAESRQYEDERELEIA